MRGGVIRGGGLLIRGGEGYQGRGGLYERGVNLSGEDGYQGRGGLSGDGGVYIWDSSYLHQWIYMKHFILCHFSIVTLFGSIVPCI